MCEGPCQGQATHHAWGVNIEGMSYNVMAGCEDMGADVYSTWMHINKDAKFCKFRLNAISRLRAPMLSVSTE